MDRAGFKIARVDGLFCATSRRTSQNSSLLRTPDSGRHTLFLLRILLSCFLAEISRSDKAKLGSLFTKLERYHVPELLLSSFLLLTQSRGPMIGAALGYSIMQVPKFRHFKLAAAALVIVLSIGGMIVHDYFEHYTTLPTPGD